MDRRTLDMALIGYQKQRDDEIDAAIADIHRRLREAKAEGEATAKPQLVTRKNRMSAEGRARIAAAQKKRWAVIRKAKKAA